MNCTLTDTKHAIVVAIEYLNPSLRDKNIRVLLVIRLLIYSTYCKQFNNHSVYRISDIEFIKKMAIIQVCQNSVCILAKLNQLDLRVILFIIYCIHNATTILFYKQLPDKRLYARNNGILVSPGLYLTIKTADQSP